MDLKSSIAEFYDNYTLKTNIPEWFVPAFRTLLSRNITISSWNDLIYNLQRVVSDTHSVYDFVVRLSENIDIGDLSKLILSISEEPVNDNYKNIVLTYVNGTTDRVKVPSDKFVDVVNNILKQSVGGDLGLIITEDELNIALSNLETALKTYTDTEVAKKTLVQITIWESDD